MKRSLLLAAVGVLAGCHGKGQSGPWLTDPNLASHSAQFFPINAGDVHGPSPGQSLTTCNQCHADRSTGASPPAPATTFKTYTCTGCHVEIRPGVFHDQIPQLLAMVPHATPAFDPNQPLVYDQACRNCHPKGIAVNHAAVFPLPHQNAAGTIVAACGDCHVSPTDRTVLGCAACHPHDLAATVTGHAAVPDFDPSATTSASALCARCHGDSNIPVQVATHSQFPIGTGAHSGPAGGACLACHPALRPAPKTFAADFNQPDCTHCHVQTTAGFHDDPTGLTSFHASRGVANFQFGTTACLQCHPNGAGAGAPLYHAQLFPIDAASKHAAVTCTACHGTNRSDVTQLKCASCHADPTQSPKFPTQHNPVGITVTVNTPTGPITVPGTVVIEIWTDPNAIPTCTPVALPTFTSVDCLKCHAQSHVDPAQGHPQADSSFQQDSHQRAGCLTCHLATTQVTAAVTPPPTGYTAIDFTQPNPPSRTASPGCYTCHGNHCVGNGN